MIKYRKLTSLTDNEIKQILTDIFAPIKIENMVRDKDDEIINGNGSFDQIEHKTPKYKTEYYQETYQDPVYRSEPVYDTKYYYQIKRWRECDRVKTSGSDRSPYFGDVDLAQGQRQGDKIERYYVHGYDTNDENHELSKYQTDYNIWTQLPNAGNTITLKITANNYITEIVSE